MMKISLGGLRAISLQSKSDINVLVEMVDIYIERCKKTNLTNNSLPTSHYRNIILPKLTMKPNTFNDSIRNLHNAGLIVRVGRGMYTISERLFN